MVEAEEKYLGIKDWWLSSKTDSKDSLQKLDDWLDFWHFQYQQWGGFLELVKNMPPSISIFLLDCLPFIHRQVH